MKERLKKQQVTLQLRVSRKQLYGESKLFNFSARYDSSHRVEQHNLELAGLHS